MVSFRFIFIRPLCGGGTAMTTLIERSGKILFPHHKETRYPSCSFKNCKRNSESKNSHKS